ncbi:hypothetical protein CLOM_g20898 [Closterium sp. NIES-68]|nr:hypothetical protein CLOM_g20898 [Closterium sp. NIES-68]GJP81805.1 hypothetical protein CLOP_g11931 [Closterium sp. NIES-67]
MLADEAHTHKRDDTTVRLLHHLPAWQSNHTHLRPRPQVHQQVLEGTYVSTRHQNRHVICIPSTDKRTNRTPQLNCRATPPHSMQGRHLQMGLASTRPGVCLQQRNSCRYWTNTILPLLRTQPTYHHKNQ